MPMHTRLRESVKALPLVGRAATWAYAASYRLAFPEPFAVRRRLAAKYLRGQGLEIGALHRPLEVPEGVVVHYVDRFDVPGLIAQYPQMAELDLVEPAFVDDGETLLTQQAESRDFVVANHFLEHTQDPIGVLRRHAEVLRPSGVILMAVPDKARTFDRFRPVTTMEHLIADHEGAASDGYAAHMREWVELVERLSGDAAEARIAELTAMQYSIHFHTFTRQSLTELLRVVRDRYATPVTIEEVVYNHRKGEVIFALRKRASD